MTHMQRISACLWFDGQAEDAAKFYTSTLGFVAIRDSTSIMYSRSIVVMKKPNEAGHNAEAIRKERA